MIFCTNDVLASLFLCSKWDVDTILIRALSGAPLFHLSEKQLRRFLDLFKSNGFLRTEGQNRNTIYLLGDSYTANNTLINKALAIGLKELKEKGEL